MAMLPSSKQATVGPHQSTIRLFRPHSIPGLPEAIQDFAARFGDGQLWGRSLVEVGQALDQRRIVAMAAPNAFGDWFLAGFAQTELCEEGQVVEVTFTVVHPAFRGYGLAEVAGSAAIMNECAELSEVRAIINTLRPTNASCRRANLKAQALVMTAYEAVTFWQLRAVVSQKIARYRSRGWPGGPDTAIVMPDTYRWAQSMMAAAQSEEGYRLECGMIIVLGCGWDDGDLRAFLARGPDEDLPKVSIWQDLMERHVA